MAERSSKKKLIEHIAALQKELLEREGLKSEISWLDHALRDRTRLLQERVKELNCIADTVKALRRRDLNFGAKMREVLEAFATGWRYPEKVRCRIVLRGASFTSESWTDLKWNMHREIRNGETIEGFIEAGYPPGAAEYAEGPFLKEEILLVDVIAECIGFFLERDVSAGTPPDAA